MILIISAPSGCGKSTLVKKLLADDKNLRSSVSITTRAKRSLETDGTDYYFRTLEEFKGYINDNALIEYNTMYDNYYGTPKSKTYEILLQGLDLVFDIDFVGMQAIKEYFANKEEIENMCNIFASSIEYNHNNYSKDSKNSESPINIKHITRVISIFLLPPSIEELENRLKMRKLENAVSLVSKNEGSLSSISKGAHANQAHNILDLKIAKKELKAQQDDSFGLRMSSAHKEIENAKYYDYILVNDKIDKTLKEVQDIITKIRNEDTK